MGEHEPGSRLRVDELLGTSLTSWPPALRRAVVHFGLLCVGIVAMTMVPIRVGRDDRTLVYIVVGSAVAALVAGAVARRRLVARLPAVQALGLAALALRRQLGLPLIGLVFFLVWTVIYTCLWLFHPDEAFKGLDPDPRLSDFFFYAVSTALTSPPEGIAAASRGVRAASLIEMLMGFAVVATYFASFLDWRGAAQSGPAAETRREPL